MSTYRRPHKNNFQSLSKIQRMANQEVKLVNILFFIYCREPVILFFFKLDALSNCLVKLIDLSWFEKKLYLGYQEFDQNYIWFDLHSFNLYFALFL